MYYHSLKALEKHMRFSKFFVPSFFTACALIGLQTLPVIGAESSMSETGLDIKKPACKPVAGEASVAVTVENILTVEGNLRAQVYSSNPEDFLEKGKKLVRVDMPVETLDKPLVCVALPAPGTYALVIMHDRNANGKADFFTEGFGFSNNPKLSIGPPDAEEVMFTAKEGLTTQTVHLNYIFGGDDKNKEKRRKLKRR
jgi:uncharacterized protein (DUF2141 family)